jgi:DNA invertase Pin-like site-specific DNA recombinase
VKRVALYMRVSSLDQHPETQLHDLRQMAAQRGYQIVHEQSFRERIDTDGPLGRAFVVIIGAIAELERNLIIESVRPSATVLAIANVFSRPTKNFAIGSRKPQPTRSQSTAPSNNREA